MILIIDDDFSVTASLGLLLKQAGYRSVAAANPEEALAALAGQPISLVLQDMNYSRATTGEEGLDLLHRIKAARPELPVVLMTAWGSIQLAVEGMKAGAADFITKPWTNPQILQVVQTALKLAADLSGRSAGQASPSRQDLDSRYDFSGIVGEDPELLGILELLGRVAASDAAVLITGESGTGKEVAAEAVHRNSRRRQGPFVKVNIGGLSTSLFESEMFGHVRGAFTDAHRDRQGRFALADGGTIFLDEIGELDLRNQVKMLRVLQDRTFEMLGTSETRTVDLRVISATNRSLPEAVLEGRFREDLLYRLNLISVQLPSLAERRGDIPLLARHFLTEAARTYGSGPAELNQNAVSWLQAQEWPGNIRQLKQLMERAVLTLGESALHADHLQLALAMDSPGTGDEKLPAVGSMTLGEMEKSMILKCLAHHDGNISRVADTLGLSRAALYRRLDRYGIKP